MPIKTTSDLETDGFTASGQTRYQQTVDDYAATLHLKAVKLGDADKGRGLDREVTHDHVRAAAHSIAMSFGKPSRSNWLVAGNVAEYALTAVGAFAVANTTKSWGTPVFIIAIVIAGILVAIRITNSR